MGNHYSGIIFDLDGVLCFTDQYHYRAWKTVADRLGIPFDESVNDRLRGVSRMESLEIILENYEGVLSREEKEQMAAEKNEIYRGLLDSMSPRDLSEEVRMTLDRLRKEGVLLAVGSSSRNARLILKRLGLEDYFDAVADGSDITRSKPDPEVFLKASEKLGLSPGECLVVEDAEAGIAAAAAGGFDSAGLGESVSEADCTYYLDAISDLCEILSQSD